VRPKFSGSWTRCPTCSPRSTWKWNRSTAYAKDLALGNDRFGTLWAFVLGGDNAVHSHPVPVYLAGWQNQGKGW
jgi:hypothetical protein